MLKVPPFTGNPKNCAGLLNHRPVIGSNRTSQFENLARDVEIPRRFLAIGPTRGRDLSFYTASAKCGHLSIGLLPCKRPFDRPWPHRQCSPLQVSS